MGDIVVPARLEDAITPYALGLDLPETVGDLLDWLIAADLPPRVTWGWHDLAVISATR